MGGGASAPRGRWVGDEWLRAKFFRAKLTDVLSLCLSTSKPARAAAEGVQASSCMLRRETFRSAPAVGLLFAPILPPCWQARQRSHSTITDRLQWTACFCAPAGARAAAAPQGQGRSVVKLHTTVLEFGLPVAAATCCISLTGCIRGPLDRNRGLQTAGMPT